MPPDMTMIEISHNGWHARIRPEGDRFAATKGYMDGRDFIAVCHVGTYATIKAAERAARREMA